MKGPALSQQTRDPMLVWCWSTVYDGGPNIKPTLARVPVPARTWPYVYVRWQDIYNESPWLALLVFGVPCLVVGIVCYALCCMEPLDEEELIESLTHDDNDETDDDHFPQTIKKTPGWKLPLCFTNSIFQRKASYFFYFLTTLKTLLCLLVT